MWPQKGHFQLDHRYVFSEDFANIRINSLAKKEKQFPLSTEKP